MKSCPLCELGAVCSREYMAVASALSPSVSSSRYIVKYGGPGPHTARSPLFFVNF